MFMYFHWPKYTLWYINIDPGKQGLEDQFPLKSGDFQGRTVNLPGGIHGYMFLVDLPTVSVKPIHFSPWYHLVSPGRSWISVQDRLPARQRCGRIGGAPGPLRGWLEDEGRTRTEKNVIVYIIASLMALVYNGKYYGNYVFWNTAYNLVLVNGHSVIIGKGVIAIYR